MPSQQRQQNSTTVSPYFRLFWPQIVAFICPAREKPEYDCTVSEQTPRQTPNLLWLPEQIIVKIVDSMIATGLPHFPPPVVWKKNSGASLFSYRSSGSGGDEISPEQTKRRSSFRLSFKNPKRDSSRRSLEQVIPEDREKGEKKREEKK